MTYINSDMILNTAKKLKENKLNYDLAFISMEQTKIICYWNQFKSIKNYKQTDLKKESVQEELIKYIKSNPKLLKMNKDIRNTEINAEKLFMKNRVYKNDY